MLLTADAERRARIAAVGFDYAAQPKREVAACDLCGGESFATVAHRDRYGFPARADACLRCGLVFLNPVLTEEAYGSFYDGVYRPLVSAYHGRLIDAATIEGEQAAYAGALAELLEPHVRRRGARTLLDVGGSTGVVAEAVGGRFGLEATLLDPAPAEVARAEARGLDAHVATLESFDPVGRRWDVVLLCQTVDHLVSVASALERLRGLVAPGGLLFVDVVDFRAAYLRGWSVEEAVKVDHPFSLTEATAEAHLARAGFRPLRKDYAADHLHVGYVCEPAEPDGDALPAAGDVSRLFRELRYVQAAPAPS